MTHDPFAPIKTGNAFDARPETAPTFPTIRQPPQKLPHDEWPAIATIREIWQDFISQKGTENE